MNYRRPHKYRAQKTVVDGITFPSKAEARRYGELKLLERADKISDLELQPAFVLQEAFRRGGKAYRPIGYVADFQYIENGVCVVEDVKGMATEAFRLKWKMFVWMFPSIDARIIK